MELQKKKPSYTIPTIFAQFWYPKAKIENEEPVKKETKWQNVSHIKELNKQGNKIYLSAGRPKKSKS